MNMPSIRTEINEDCKKCIRSVQDTLEVVESKWKLHILILLKLENRRFNELLKNINGITPKALSKELKELEENQLITRTVYNIFPPHVEYSITDHGLSLESVFASLKTWGDSHRKKIIEPS
jgi:DNA-binding HxlR family transcriptional regulator